MAAVVAPHHNTMWQQRRPDQAMHMPSLSMPGMLPPFDATSRAPTAPPAQKAYPPSTVGLTMPMFQNHGFNSPLPFQHPSQYAYDNHSQAEYSMQPAYGMHQPTQMHHQSIGYQPTNTVVTSLPHVRDARNAFPPVNRSPSVKTENPSPATATPALSTTAFPDAVIVDSTIRQHGSPTKPETGTSFSTDVDTLMRTIQAKGGSEHEEEEQQQHQQPPPPPPQQQQQVALPQVSATSGLAVSSPTQSQPPKIEGQPRNGKSRKRYQCSMPNCNKYFYQKTHLEIHTRAHTGIKPFLCHEPSCGQRFSQLGNLKTHERRHTGERPYKCDICAKTFAQRGNVRAHKIVHQQIKPFTCRLDDCGKQFTQLGNLKSHQNKFHAHTLRYLTQKFTSVHPADHISPQDQETWEYFADLYKNSNKGIKGRGKDRRISTVSSSAASSSISSASSSSSAASLQFGHKNGSVSSAVTTATTATGMSNEARSISSRASSFVSSPEMYQHHQQHHHQPLHPHHNPQQHQQQQQQQHHPHHQPQYQQHPHTHHQNQQRHQSLPQLLNHQQQSHYSPEQNLQQHQHQHQHHPQHQQQQQAQHHPHHQRKVQEESRYDFHQPVQPVEVVGVNGEYHAQAAAAAAAAAATHGYGNLVFPERKMY